MKTEKQKIARKEYRRGYYIKNRDKNRERSIAYSRQYRMDNPRVYTEADREKIRLAAKIWRANNLERSRANTARWKLKNPGSHRHRTYTCSATRPEPKCCEICGSFQTW